MMCWHSAARPSIKLHEELRLHTLSVAESGGVELVHGAARHSTRLHVTVLAAKLAGLVFKQ